MTNVRDSCNKMGIMPVTLSDVMYIYFGNFNVPSNMQILTQFVVRLDIARNWEPTPFTHLSLLELA